MIENDDRQNTARREEEKANDLTEIGRILRILRELSLRQVLTIEQPIAA